MKIVHVNKNLLAAELKAEELLPKLKERDRKKAHEMLMKERIKPRKIKIS